MSTSPKLLEAVDAAVEMLRSDMVVAATAHLGDMIGPMLSTLTVLVHEERQHSDFTPEYLRGRQFARGLIDEVVSSVGLDLDTLKRAGEKSMEDLRSDLSRRGG